VRLLLGALVVWTFGVGLEWEGRLARLERELESGDVTRRVEVVRLLGGYSADEVRRALLRALEDPEPSVRREAAEVVGRVRLRDALPMLLEWLEDPDAEVRAVAATSLGRLHENAAQGPLVRALGDAEASVRRAAVRALVELGEPSALVPILGRLDDLDPDVRVETARGLARLGDPRAVVPLIGRARDDSVQVRQAVVGALGSLGDARAVPTVVLALRDDDEDVRLAAMGALGRLRDERASTELVAIAREGETRAARAALSALGAIGGERAREVAVESLANAELRPLASEVLSESTAPGETTWLADRIARIDARDHASALATVVLRRLRRNAEPSAAPALLAALERDVDHATVLRALASSGEPDVLVRLLTELGRESEPVRLAALEAIEDYFAIHPPDGRAADPLLAVLGRVPPSQRVRVVRLLGTVRAARATSAVRPLLDSNDPTLRLAAVETLGALGDPRGTEALEPLLDADDGAVRDAAARALGRVADDATTRRLVTKLADRAPTDRHALFTALGEALARGVTGDVTVTLATLERFVRHADDALAAGAVATLGRWADEGARDLLVTLARDEAYGSRAAAILALARASLGTSANGPAAEVVALFREITTSTHASPATRAAAWIALGATGDASDVEPLVRGVRESPGPIAAAAAFGLAQRLRRDPDAPVEGDALCALLARRDAYVRANVMVALAARRVSCRDRVPGTYLGREHAESVRAAAARWAAARGQDDEALARCAAEDLAPNVAHACAQPGLPPLDADVDVHAFAGDERTRLRHALVALRLADGTALVAWTDANGRLLWPLAPRGPIQLDDPLRVPLQP
jgi:HEAT repeat protein